MVRSRYREERTLARGLRRLPGEDRTTFRNKINRLRKHFEQFNLDVSELSQWLMGLRPNGKKFGDDTKPFWQFMLNPEESLADTEPAECDRARFRVFEVTVGLDSTSDLSSLALSPELIDSARIASSHAPSINDVSTTAGRMIARLQKTDRSHRRILLKAAIELIASRYVQGYDNWVRRREEWEKEKVEWEKKQPELTTEVREKYNAIFRSLGIKDKRLRVCTWIRSWDVVDKRDDAWRRVDCRTRKHSDLCLKFRGFCRSNVPRKEKFFIQNVETYLSASVKKRLTCEEAMNVVLTNTPRARGWFPEAWRNYLGALELTEGAFLRGSRDRLPHCTKFSNSTDCDYNPHTELCRQYRANVEQLTETERNLEGLYREWRRRYLSGPRKPFLQYPSKRTASVAKIFGKDYCQIDFESSVLQLRLDDMPAGEFLSFGFKPWPNDYDTQPDSTTVTSVSIHFVGTRARVGFRFIKPHRQSRLEITQDEIDQLRSRKYPRAAQDQEFLDEVRSRLLARFAEEPDKALRLMCVDLGVCGGWGLFEGKKFVKSGELKIVKLDKLYEQKPSEAARAKPNTAESEDELEITSGLNEKHVGRHLASLADGAAKIAAYRKSDDKPELSDHDLRRLLHHIRWMIRDWVRLNASQVIAVAEEAGVDLIVFESMRGFSAPGYDQLDPGKKRRLAFFAYGSVRRKVAEKAVERGMRVVTAPYKFSSQVCSKCGRRQENRNRLKKNKSGKEFRCEYADCGLRINSDENAARVLGLVFWGDIKLPAE